MYKQENKFLRINFNFSDSRKRKKKEEKFLSAKYQVRVGISNRFVYIYIFFHSLIFVKAGIIYNISKVKCILEENLFATNIEKKKKKEIETTNVLS